MRTAFALLMVVVAVSGCAGAARHSAPAQPVLESVRILGTRICGNAPAGTAATLPCPELPASVATAWRLSPGWETRDQGRLRANRTVVLNVSGPLATEIDVELARGPDQLNRPLQAINPVAAGSPGEVAATGQVGITTFDEATRRNWIIEVVVSTCADLRHLQIFNRAARASGRSAPLDVYLVRDPDTRVCIGATGVGIGDPATPRPPGGCAGGGTGKAFEVCETCPSVHPRGLSIHASGSYCSWEQVLQAYGYDDENSVRARSCRLSQVGSREACEGR